LEKKKEMSALYETLGVTKHATSHDIKRAYRKLAMQNHPDKGGNSEQFQKITAAYEILSDETKKRRYDMVGDVGGEGDAMDPMSMFRSFFNQTSKVPSVVFELQLTLEEIFSGVTKKLRITKKMCCVTCKGLGCELTDTICSVCTGRPVTCHQCLGHRYQLKGVCLSCHGKKLQNVQKLIQVTIPAGTETNHVIVLSEEGDGIADFNVKPGDLHIKVLEKPHPLFQRRGINLFHKMNIQLVESMIGFHQTLQHLNGETITVQSDQVLSQHSIWTFRHYGMKPSGNLFIQINIIIQPSTVLSPSVKKQIADAFQYEIKPPHTSALLFKEMYSAKEPEKKQNVNGCPVS
jgi:DnaJ-class molecular chaperone